MKYQNLIIIGTSHISQASITEVENTIIEKSPEIVCVELDRGRYSALMSGKKKSSVLKEIKYVGVKGYLFNLIGGYVENKLGKYVGVKPGSEMLKAIYLAKKHKALVALIDQDIAITLRRFSEEFTWKEKYNLFIDIFKGIFFKNSEMKKLGLDKFDLNKVPTKKVISRLLKTVKKRYPNFYKVMIDERNKIMADRLYRIMSQNPHKQILAVVGAGHEEEIIDLIKEQHKDAVMYEFTIS